jgi:hypothetical protein
MLQYPYRHTRTLHALYTICDVGLLSDTGEQYTYTLKYIIAYYQTYKSTGRNVSSVGSVWVCQYKSCVFSSHCEQNIWIRYIPFARCVNVTALSKACFSHAMSIWCGRRKSFQSVKMLAQAFYIRSFHHITNVL